MTQEEARAVLQLGLEGGTDPQRIRVEDVAETLQMSPLEVEALLARVRGGSMEAEMAQHHQRDMRRLTITLAVAALFVVIVGFAGGAYLFLNSRSEPMPTKHVIIRGDFPDVPPMPEIEVREIR
ncbi:hypothetical protein EON81_14630 [bacterium]|nr:MAG: hypothetical protein EON81_14630 [bacterium]